MPSISTLVTGGAGFIGSHVADRLVAQGHQVRVVDNLSTGDERNLDQIRDRIDFVRGDLTDPEVCRQVTDGVDLVFHLAALASVPRSMEDPEASYRHNVVATMNLILAGRETGVRRMVYSSSSSVYGDTEVLPKVESMEPQPMSPYAGYKLSGEQLVLAFARAGIFEGAALRYFNVFGPRQSPASAYAAVVPVFMQAAQNGTAAPVFGDGGQTRDFTYVDNVVSANLLAGMGPAERVSGMVCNVGAGERTSLLDLVRLIGEVSGRSLSVAHQPVRAGDVRDSLASMERAHDRLGYRVEVGLLEGLQRTWDHFITR